MRGESFNDRWDPADFLSFDLETWLFVQGNLAPPMVCGAIADEHEALLIRSDSGDRAEDKALTRQAIVRWLESQRVIVGCNLPYDLLVSAVEAQKHDRVDLMPLIFDKFKRHQIFDVSRAEELHAIAEGCLHKDPRTMMPLRNRSTGKNTNKYSLDICVELVLGRTDAKINDEYKKRYATLDDEPIDTWPVEARQYPVDDVVNTLDVAVEQVARNRNLHVLGSQVFKAWALHLGAAWGLRTDPVLVEVLEAAARAGAEAGRPTFVSLGFIREDGSEDQSTVKRAVAAAYGCEGVCDQCGGTGKIYKKRAKRHTFGLLTVCAYCGCSKAEQAPQCSKPVGNPVNCGPCNGTGLDLSTGPVPMTEPTEKGLAKAAEAGEVAYGNVKIGRDILVESGDEELIEYGAYQEDDKVLSTYVPFLKKGIDRPITLSPNPILKSLRVSYDGVVQLLPRNVSARLMQAIEAQLRELGLEGEALLGVRDCIIARPGHLIYSVDYKGGELVTFAESAYERVGFSKMGEALVAGIDVHSDFAAFVKGCSYDEFIGRKKEPLFKAFRQAAKPENFGLPGGMGVVTLVLQQREQGPDTPCPGGPSRIWDGKKWVDGYKGLRFCILLGRDTICGREKTTQWGRRECPPVCVACLRVAEELKAAWFERWPEARLYLDWHAENADNVGEVTLPYSEHVCGGIAFCDSANGDFQTRLALIAGEALCQVAEEQYCDRRSPLWGSRGIPFQHDELLGECAIPKGHAVCGRVVEIMVEKFRLGCPVHAAACDAEPTLMHRWYKAGEPVWNNGVLMPWVPEAIRAAAA